MSVQKTFLAGEPLSWGVCQHAPTAFLTTMSLKYQGQESKFSNKTNAQHKFIGEEESQL
jgi:hypothetical protein